jgi:hypothetical protein
MVQGPVDDLKILQESNRGADSNQTHGDAESDRDRITIRTEDSWLSDREWQWGFISIPSTIIVSLSTAEKKINIVLLSYLSLELNIYLAI